MKKILNQIFGLILYSSIIISSANHSSKKESSTTINQPSPVRIENAIENFQSLGRNIPITGNTDQMKHFLNALKNIKNKSVRVAHYGDSMIFGDVITDQIRNKMQQRFGGIGIGLLNIISEDARMRLTIKQTYSNDWENISFITRNPKQLPLGITGAFAIPKVGSWVKYETNAYIKTNSTFSVVKIFYSDGDQSSIIQYSIDDSIIKKESLQSGKGIKELEIQVGKNAHKLEVTFMSGKAPYIYAVSLESNSGGVYVDNIPMRGNSGVALLEMPDLFLNDFNKYLDYDLIILNFGANVYSPNKGIYTVYENKMISAIERFKKNFPNTSFLLISTADRVKKAGPRLITDPDLTFLIETQKRIAEKTKIAFWNLFEVMGGTNSMPLWVDSNPALANKDYVHLNYLGGEKVAGYLLNALLNLEK